MFDLARKSESTVLYKEKDIQIDLAFDTVLIFYELLDDELLSTEDKINQSFSLFVVDDNVNTNQISFEDKVEILALIREYISQSPYDDDKENGSNQNESDTQADIKVFSYKKDAASIYSSFLYDYKIDLDNERGKMHYDRFKALLAGLSEETHFKRILRIRQTDTSKLEGEELTAML